MQNSLDFYALTCKIVGMDRKQKTYILKDLNHKMVFITGPRQTGKTWLVYIPVKPATNSDLCLPL